MFSSPKARASTASESSPSGLCMKKPTKRCGLCATASATDRASPGALAISATRETWCLSSSAIQRSPSSVGVPGASHCSRRAIASAPPPSGAVSSRKWEEKKWQWASFSIVSDVRDAGAVCDPGVLEGDHLYRHFRRRHSQPGDARFEIKTFGPRRTRVDDESRSEPLDERLVRVAVDNYIRFVAREQLVGRRASELVAMADVDRSTVDLEIERCRQARLTG